MKTLALLALAVVISFGVASAQDVTGFNSKAGSGSSGPSVNNQKIKTPPNPHPDLKPQLGGALVAIAKDGPVMISPAAPASYGIGAKYLSAPNQFHGDQQSTCAPANHRDAGGIKLFSFEF